jgi:hypothetical protein
MLTANKTRGWYFVVSAGGNTDADITRFNAFFVEIDTLPLDDQHRLFDASPIHPSIRLETRKSVHAYWLVDGECDIDAWREVQGRLIAYFDSDRSIKNPSRVMRLPFFNHVHYNAEKKDYEYKQVSIVAFAPERKFTVAEMRGAFTTTSSQPQAAILNDANIFVSWDELNAELRRRIMAAGKQNGKGIFETRGICHNGNGETALMLIQPPVRCIAQAIASLKTRLTRFICRVLSYAGR